jgi:hypothetical protein
MAIAQQIHEAVQQLPSAAQAKVLDFIEYLVAKHARTIAQQEARDWSAVSLGQALRRMDAAAAEYSLEDVRVRFA